MAALNKTSVTIIVLLANIMVFAVGIYFILLPSQYTCVRIPQEPRTVVDDTDGLTNLWNLGIRISNDHKRGNRLLATDNSLLVVDGGCRQIVAFDLQTGTVLWEQPVNGSSLTLDSQQNDMVYITEISGSKRRLHALSARTGAELWSNKEFDRQRIGLNVHMNTEQEPYLYVGSGSIADSVYWIDRETGKLEKLPNLPKDILLVNSNITWIQNGCNLDAVDTETQQIIWRWCNPSITSRIALRPTIVGNLMILQHSGEVSALSVLDWRTGAVLWQLEDDLIVSNIEEDKEHFYMLTYTARLLKIEKFSGNIIETIQFNPPENTDPNEIMIGEGHIGGSWLAISGSTIAIYFQDTQVLSVFKMDVVR